MSFATSRVFKGLSRALLAPAKSSSSTSATASKPSAKAAAEAGKPKPKRKASPAQKPNRATPIRPSGILKLAPISPALSDFLGAPEASRTDAVKKIWVHIKQHNLQNPTNKKEIICDEKLKVLFEGKEKVGFLEIGKLLTRHFVKTA